VALGWGDNSWGEYGWGGAIPLTGTVASGGVGTVTVFSIEVALTGVSASGDLGQVIQAKGQTLVGVDVSGSTGTVIPNIDTATLAGWSESTWGSYGWGGIVQPGVVASGNAGTVAQGKSDLVFSTSGSGNLGTTVSNLSISLLGVTAEAVAGAETTGAGSKLLSTVNVSGDLGTLGVGNRDIALSGVGAGGELGVMIDGIGHIISGVSADVQVGTVVQGKTEFPTGVVATGLTGTLTKTVSVALTGNGARGTAGTIGYRYWSVIDDTQTPNWVVITTF
jgi:hypothetical protein